MKKIDYNTNEIHRSYYLNLFSENAERRLTFNGKVTEFTWQIRNLQLGSIAEVGLIQLCANNASDNTTYAIRTNNSFGDGYDSYNVTSSILYLGNGLQNPGNVTYHKLISDNLNYITLIITDDITSNAGVYSGIDASISFGVVLEVIDYLDPQQNY